MLFLVLEGIWNCGAYVRRYRILKLLNPISYKFRGKILFNLIITHFFFEVPNLLFLLLDKVNQIQCSSDWLASQLKQIVLSYWSVSRPLSVTLKG